VGATVGAVAVLLLVSIVVFGILGPRFQLFGRPGNSGHPVTFAQAESASDGVAAGHPGGPWNLTSVTGYASSQGYTWPSAGSPPSCDQPWAQPAIPASGGPLLFGGTSSYWEFFYISPQGAELSVVVLSDQVEVTGYVPAGMHCLPPGYIPLNESSMAIVDSSVAIQALPSSFSEFLSNHTMTNGYLQLIPPGSANASSPWTWYVIVTACPLGPQGLSPPFTGPHYEGWVDAINGTLLAFNPGPSTTCSTS